MRGAWIFCARLGASRVRGDAGIGSKFSIRQRGHDIANLKTSAIPGRAIVGGRSKSKARGKGAAKGRRFAPVFLSELKLRPPKDATCADIFPALTGRANLCRASGAGWVNWAAATSRSLVRLLRRGGRKRRGSLAALGMTA